MAQCVLMQKKKYNEKILWTNPNPSASYNSEVIDVANQGYKAIKITYKQATNTSEIFSTIIDTSDFNIFDFDKCTPSITTVYTGVAYFVRTIQFGENRFIISRAISFNGTSVDNSRTIPLQIIGIK